MGSAGMAPGTADNPMIDGGMGSGGSAAAGSGDTAGGGSAGSAGHGAGKGSSK
jgi:hypothetical protein